MSEKLIAGVMLSKGVVDAYNKKMDELDSKSKSYDEYKYGYMECAKGKDIMTYEQYINYTRLGSK